MSLARRTWAALGLMIGFYSMVIGISVAVFVVSSGLLTWLVGERQEQVFGMSAGLGLALFIMAFPSIIKRKPAGVRLDPKNQPELFDRLARIAQLTGHKMPVEVILTTQATAWALPFGMTGIGNKWVLGLGLPLIQTHTVSQFDAVLAHEFGHALVGDTRLSPIISETHSAIERVIDFLEAFCPPLKKPFALYRRMFLRIILPTARGQECAADRLAASVAGSDAIIESLRTLTRISEVTSDYFDWEVCCISNAGFIPPVVEGFATKLSYPSVIASMDEALAKELAKSQPDDRDPHPHLAQRIAMLEQVAPCNNPDKTPALSLLRDLPSLEHQLIVSRMRVKNKKLKPIAWTDVGASVWIPTWERIAIEWSQRIMGETIGSLFDRAGTLNSKGCQVFGIGLACRLHRAGWTVESGPGIHSLTKGALKLNPFETVNQIAAGQFTREEWNARISALGLDPSMPLYPAPTIGRLVCNLPIRTEIKPAIAPSKEVHEPSIFFLFLANSTIRSFPRVSRP